MIDNDCRPRPDLVRPARLIQALEIFDPTIGWLLLGALLGLVLINA